jgi:YfiH family protein
MPTHDARGRLPRESSTETWLAVTHCGICWYELQLASVRLIFTTRINGASSPPFAGLNLSYDVGDNPDCVKENWNRLNAVLGHPVITLKQVHSTTVVPILSGVAPAGPPEGDACFTDRHGPALAIKVADCLPVYVFAADGSCRGIAHCGWRGTAGRIAEKLCCMMSRQFKLALTDLRFALGPCICGECYVVGEDVRRALAAASPTAGRFLLPVRDNSSGTWLLDLRAANRWMLKEMGLTEVTGLDLCTKENPELFYSVRRDSRTGRNLAIITTP